MSTFQERFASAFDAEVRRRLDHAGMLLIVDPALSPEQNDFVIAKNGDNEATFKQLVKDGNDWYLKPMNQRYPIKPLGSSRIIGVVRFSGTKHR